MNKRMELLEELEPIIEKKPQKSSDKVQEMSPISYAGNLPVCGGPVYSNTYWLPEDAEIIMNDLLED